MKFQQKFCLALVFLSVVIHCLTASCIWYDNCYQDSETKVDKACPYFGRAKPLEDVKAAAYLARRCPNLFKKDEKGKLKTCCSPNQINNLKAIFSRLKEVAGQCPSCFANIAHLFCGFTCSPDQAAFMSGPEIKEPSESVEFELPKDPETAAIMLNRHPLAKIRPHDTCSTHSYISAVKSVKIDKATVDAIVESCSNVQYYGKPLFDQIFLQPMTVQSLFSYIGNPEMNRNVAVKLGFQSVSDGSRLNFATYACSDVEPVSNRTCKCQDCPSSCPTVVKTAAAPFRHHLSSKWDLPLMIIVSVCAIVAIILSLILACRIFNEKSSSFEDNKGEQRTSNAIMPGYQMLPSTIYIEQRKIGTDFDNKNSSAVFTALDNTKQKPYGFWQRLGPKYWTGGDYSTFTYPRYGTAIAECPEYK